jgi:DNA-binding transcriptional LysR family regulator
VSRGRRVIGSLDTTAAERLAPLLTACTRDFPAVELSLKTGTTCELIEAVREGSRDGAFVCGLVVNASLNARTTSALREFLSGATRAFATGLTHCRSQRSMRSTT